MSSPLTARANPPGKPIGDRTLLYVVTKFLPSIYPTVASLASDPTTVTVYSLNITQTGTDQDLSTPLRKLPLSRVVALLNQFTFEVIKYTNGTRSSIGTYVIQAQPPNPGTPGTFNGGTFASNFGTLWLVDLAVDLLGQIQFTVTKSGGTPSNYVVTGTLEDWVEINQDLETPLGSLSPKYIFLLKKLFNFTVQPAGQSGPFHPVTLNGNKIQSE